MNKSIILVLASIVLFLACAIGYNLYQQHSANTIKAMRIDMGKQMQERREMRGKENNETKVPKETHQNPLN